MANNTAGGAGALLSGLAGGYVGGMQLQNFMDNQKKPADPNHQSTGTAVQNAANQPGTLGTPGSQPTQITSLGLPDQGVPGAGALPPTPDAKAATTEATGNWGTIGGYLGGNTTQPPQQQPQAQSQAQKVAGMLESGNINLHNRPVVKNADGSISTVRTISINDGTGEVVIPTVSDDGRIISNDEAVQLYRKTGKHFGKFSSVDDATNFAVKLHNEQADEYVPAANR